MRPLTEEEYARACHVGYRVWRDLWLLLFKRLGVYLTFCLLILWVASTREEGALAWFLVVPLLFAPFALVTFWRAWRQQRRDLDIDLRSGVVEQKVGRIYDRLGLRSILFPRRYVFWAEGDRAAIEVLMEKSEAKKFRVGDAIQVDVLPRSCVIIGVRKLDSP